MTDSSWPQAPTCHSGDRQYPGMPPIAWSVPRRDEKYGQHESFRRCSYCGSVHPGDLVALLKSGQGVRMHGADWKYGWPHKFYVEGIPNLTPRVDCSVGSSWKDGVETPILGKSSAVIMAKFYNDHLNDEGYGEDELSELISLIETQTGIAFTFGDKGLRYAAPSAGYQR